VLGVPVDGRAVPVGAAVPQLLYQRRRWARSLKNVWCEGVMRADTKK